MDGIKSTMKQLMAIPKADFFFVKWLDTSQAGLVYLRQLQEMKDQGYLIKVK